MLLEKLIPRKSKTKSHTSEESKSATPSQPSTESDSQNNSEQSSEDETEDPDPAYDLTRSNTVRFTESVSIDTTDRSDHASITVETIADELTFDVRVNGFTTRYGTLDVEYITGGGYSISLYHPQPDEIDSYVVRKLFYYLDVPGIGGQRRDDGWTQPSADPLWDRSEDYGDIVESEIDSTYIEVYDWRENMLTHNKPTPSEGEVVLQFTDSLRSGGNRDSVDTVINTTSTDLFSNSYTVQYISVDPDTKSYILHSKTENQDYEIRFPIGEKEPTIGDCTVQEVTGIDDPQDIENLIWTREPEDTWHIKGIDPKEKQ